MYNNLIINLSYILSQIYTNLVPNRSQIGPKSVPNRSQIGPKSAQNPPASVQNAPTSAKIHRRSVPNREKSRKIYKNRFCAAGSRPGCAQVANPNSNFSLFGNLLAESGAQSMDWDSCLAKTVPNLCKKSCNRSIPKDTSCEMRS